MHLNKYEYIKNKHSYFKEKKLGKLEQNLNTLFEESNEKSHIVVETKYHSAIILDNNIEKEVLLEKPLSYPLNKILFVGDKVVIKNNKIIKIITRNNLLCRNTKDGTRNSEALQSKVIAANVDIIFIVASFGEPKFHPRFVDRYLLIAHYNNIKPIIIVNKYDLMSKEEEKLLDIYKDSGEEVILTSTIDNYNIDEIKSLSKEKTIILVGSSGVGKSSIISKIADTYIKVSEVSDFSKKGKHTTTSSKVYEWNISSYVIDTPGIRALDISFIPKSEIKNYYGEFDNYICKYKNCLHDKEDGCAVKEAVNSGILSKERYDSYLRLLNQ